MIYVVLPSLKRIMKLFLQRPSACVGKYVSYDIINEMEYTLIATIVIHLYFSYHTPFNVSDSIIFFRYHSKLDALNLPNICTKKPCFVVFMFNLKLKLKKFLWSSHWMQYYVSYYQFILIGVTFFYSNCNDTLLF